MLRNQSELKNSHCRLKKKKNKVYIWIVEFKEIVTGMLKNLTLNSNNVRQLSFSLSILLHLLLFVFFLLWKFQVSYKAPEFVELSFGNGIGSGSPGGGALGYEQFGETPKLSEASGSATQETEKVKEIALPKALHTDKESSVKPSDKDTKSKVATPESHAGTEKGVATNPGLGNGGEGPGGFGFDINWGGNGTRRIYNYPLPGYPEGVEKEFNVRLRFTIRPDGTVGTIMPLTKGDTRLENAAINSLRQWRFEPLSPNQKQAEQTAVIVFPYRLR
jgi:protein TonB